MQLAHPKRWTGLRDSILAYAVLALVALSVVARDADARSPSDPSGRGEAEAVAQSLDGWIERVSVLPLAVAVHRRVAGSEADSKTVEFLSALLGEMPAPDVYGVYLAYEDAKYTDSDSMPWVDRKSWPRATIVQYDYHASEWEWYNGPKSTGKLTVTDAYFDKGGSNIPMVSVTRPVNDTAGRFIGVAGADVSLSDIRNRAGAQESGADSGDSSPRELYVVSRSGKIIAHPNPQLMLREDYPGEDVRNLPGGKQVSASASGSVVIGKGGATQTLYWVTAPLTGWKVVVSVPHSKQ